MTALMQPLTANSAPQASPIAQPLDKLTTATDSELLSEFTGHRSQEAFTEIVRRHASMVLGVCRRVVRDEHEAEDLFQATFLILATKARKIRRRHRASLAAWLHRVAYRAALREAKAKHRADQRLEDDVPSTESEQWSTIATQEEQLILHETINKLPEMYREAIVLCCLEGQSRVDAAARLGTTPEAVQKRVSRGKQMLQLRLARLRVVAPVALAAAAVPCAAEAATLPPLISLTSEIAAATVLHGDKSVFSTHVGRLTLKGADSMGTLLAPAAAITAALALGGSFFMFAGNAQDNAAPPAAGEVAIVESGLLAPDGADAETSLDLADATLLQVAMVDDLQEDTPENEKLRVILSRQKGDTLKVYMNERSKYINGKSVSPKQIAAFIEQSGLEKAVITAEAYLAKSKIDAIEQVIRDAGIDDVSRTQPVRLSPEEQREETVKLIAARQKGEQLTVYLNNRGAYINGKSVSADLLPDIVEESGLTKAVISAEPYLAQKRVVIWQQHLKDAGIEEISFTTPKQD